MGAAPSAVQILTKRVFAFFFQKKADGQNAGFGADGGLIGIRHFSIPDLAVPRGFGHLWRYEILFFNFVALSQTAREWSVSLDKVAFFVAHE